MKKNPLLICSLSILATTLWFGCSGSDPATTTTVSTFSIGGSVTGLDGTLVLKNNGGDNLSITADGDFTFDTEIDDGDDYTVTISTKPTGQTCTITHATGTATADVTNVAVTCEDKKTIFITAAPHNGDFDTGSGGAAGADAFCMADANYPGTGTYKAMIVVGSLSRTACSTANCSGGSSEHIDWVLSPNTMYYRDNETTEIGETNSAGIFTFPLTNAFASTFETTWTGMLGDWTADTTCTGWSDGTGGDIGTYGDTNDTSSNQISFTQDVCSTTLKIICVEQ